MEKYLIVAATPSAELVTTSDPDSHVPGVYQDHEVLTLAGLQQASTMGHYVHQIPYGKPERKPPVWGYIFAEDRRSDPDVALAVGPRRADYAAASLILAAADVATPPDDIFDLYPTIARVPCVGAVGQWVLAMQKVLLEKDSLTSALVVAESSLAAGILNSALHSSTAFVHPGTLHVTRFVHNRFKLV